MKSLTTKILAALVASSLLCAPSLEAQSTKEVLKSYREALSKRIGSKTGKAAIKAAGKVFAKSINKSPSNAVKLVKLANKSLGKIISRKDQTTRALNFIKTITSRKVFRKLVTLPKSIFVVTDTDTAGKALLESARGVQKGALVRVARAAVDGVERNFNPLDFPGQGPVGLIVDRITAPIVELAGISPTSPPSNDVSGPQNF